MTGDQGVVRRLRATWGLLVKELAAFGVVGAVATVLDLGLFQLLYAGLGVGAVASRLGSTAVATTFAFVGHRYWSFSHRARTGVRRESVLFTAVNGTTLLLGLGIVWLVSGPLGYTSALVLQAANVGSIAVGTTIRFLAYRRWVFPAAEVTPPSETSVAPPPTPVSHLPQQSSEAALRGPSAG